MELDEKDKILYEHLFYDARRSSHELAKILRMKQPSVYARIKKLEQEGFISRYDSLITTHTLPLIYKMYYTSLTPLEVKEILEMPQCFGLQELFGEYIHQIFCFFRNNEEVRKFEKNLPKKRISQLLTKSYRLGGSIFDIKRVPEKYFDNEQKIKLDKTDINLLHNMIIGGARKTTVELADELGVNWTVVKYRKKRLIQNGYFLYFIAQPGEAFKSLKIAYHIFSLKENIDIKMIEGMPRCVIAYAGNKTLTVIQLSLTFDDYLKNSNSLIRRLEPHTKKVTTFFVNKPIILNRLSENLLINKS
jgi:Lrp/AsnC family leucine-responsive transcriptional regulator